MMDKRLGMLMFLGLFVLLSSTIVIAQGAEQAGEMVFEQLKNLITNEYIAYGLTVIFFFMLLQGIFAAGLKVVPIFKKGDGLLNKQGNVVSVALSLISTLAIFYLNQGGLGSSLEDKLRGFELLGGIAVAIVVFGVTYNNLHNQERGKDIWLAITAVGLSMYVWGHMTNNWGVSSWGVFMMIVGGVFVLFRGNGTPRAAGEGDYRGPGNLGMGPVDRGPRGRNPHTTDFDNNAPFNGVVVDSMTHQPVRNALIELKGRTNAWGFLGNMGLNQSKRIGHAYTDAQGRFHVGAAPLDHIHIHITHPDYEKHNQLIPMRDNTGEVMVFPIRPKDIGGNGDQNNPNHPNPNDSNPNNHNPQPEEQFNAIVPETVEEIEDKAKDAEKEEHKVDVAEKQEEKEVEHEIRDLETEDKHLKEMVAQLEKGIKGGIFQEKATSKKMLEELEVFTKKAKKAEQVADNYIQKVTNQMSEHADKEMKDAELVARDLEQILNRERQMNLGPHPGGTGPERWVQLVKISEWIKKRLMERKTAYNKVNAAVKAYQAKIRQLNATLPAVKAALEAEKASEAEQTLITIIRQYNALIEDLRKTKATMVQLREYSEKLNINSYLDKIIAFMNDTKKKRFKI